MAIYMPPLCRKKRVLERYDPDTYRVISQYAEETHPTYGYEPTNEPSEWRREWLQNSGLALPDIHTKKTEVLPHSAPDYRIHKPHPGSCGFLRNNVRLLNEPICSVYTDVTRNEQQHWWPSRVSDEPLKVPERTKDTIYRGDFDQKEVHSASFGSRRHTSNPNTEPALGTVPVNFLKARDGQQRLFKEKISYEHQYNSRVDPNYPIRAKRHGSFVWDQLPPERTKRFIEMYGQYNVITPEQGVARQEQIEAQKLAQATANVTASPKGTKKEPGVSPQEKVSDTQVPPPQKVSETQATPPQKASEAQATPPQKASEAQATPPSEPVQLAEPASKQNCNANGNGTNNADKNGTDVNGKKTPPREK